MGSSYLQFFLFSHLNCPKITLALWLLELAFCSRFTEESVNLLREEADVKCQLTSLWFLYLWNLDSSSSVKLISSFMSPFFSILSCFSYSSCLEYWSGASNSIMVRRSVRVIIKKYVYCISPVLKTFTSHLNQSQSHYQGTESLYDLNCSDLIF